jgi:hypothetical protein
MVTRYFDNNVGLMVHLDGRGLQGRQGLRQFDGPCRHVPKKSRSSALPAICGCGPSMKPSFLEPELGGDRLGIPSRLAPRAAQPKQALHVPSEEVLSGGRWVDIPPALQDVQAISSRRSFRSPVGENSKRTVGIRATRFPPMSLPNVPRNVIAHELGHPIARLAHNGDPTTLMCGRPASCRPDVSRSDQPRMFSLTENERRRLLTLDPR